MAEGSPPARWVSVCLHMCGRMCVCVCAHVCVCLCVSVAREAARQKKHSHTSKHSHTLTHTHTHSLTQCHSLLHTHTHSVAREAARRTTQQDRSQVATISPRPRRPQRASHPASFEQNAFSQVPHVACSHVCRTNKDFVSVSISRVLYGESFL